MKRPEKFTLTADHIKLVQSMFIGWDDCESGAPAVDPKRPYGNSYVPGDVRRILGWATPDPDDEHVQEAADERAYKIHRETEVALQIIIRLGPVPGVYELADQYDRASWRKVAS